MHDVSCLCAQPTYKDSEQAAFEDMTAEIDEPNGARMGFLTKARIRTAIRRAAALSGVDDSALRSTLRFRPTSHSPSSQCAELFCKANHVASVPSILLLFNDDT